MKKPDYEGFLELLDEESQLSLERRMRTLAFVVALYKRKGIEVTPLEAAEKLRDKVFLDKMIKILSSLEDQLGKAPEEQEDPNKTISIVADSFLEEE